MDFRFKEQVEELAYVTACVGHNRLLIAEPSGLNTMELYERMWDTLTASEQMYCEKLQRQMDKIDQEVIAAKLERRSDVS